MFAGRKMTKKTKRITVTGIDGSGKSTITGRLIDFLKETGNSDIIVMNCPAYHHTKNAPFSELSQELEAFTQIADKLKSFELKAVSLYLQITLFGLVEKCLVDMFQPQVLINERHAIIDVLSYGQFYKYLLQKPMDRASLEKPLMDMLEAYKPGTVRSINRWVHRLAKKSGREFSLWDMESYILEPFQKEGRHLVNALCSQFETSLPDMVILLDIEGEKASGRIEKREDEHVELHEQTEILEMLRKEYFNVISLLNKEFPEVVTYVVDTDGKKGIDETLKKVHELCR